MTRDIGLTGDKKDICATIRQLRLLLGLEQHEFAELMGVVKGTVWNWENGKRVPRLPKIRKMVEIAERNKIRIKITDFLV